MKLNIKDPEFSEHIRLTLLAVLVGLVAGFASILFKLMIQFFQNLFWRAESIISVVATQPWYLTILIPAAGALLISPLIYYGAREAKGHGVPEIMESLVFRGGRIRTKVVAIKALASSICQASQHTRHNTALRRAPSLQRARRAPLGTTARHRLQSPE